MLDYRGHQSIHLLTLVLCQSVLRKNRFAIRMHDADPPRSLSFKRLKPDLFLHFPAISSSLTVVATK